MNLLQEIEINQETEIKKLNMVIEDLKHENEFQKKNMEIKEHKIG